MKTIFQKGVFVFYNTFYHFRVTLNTQLFSNFAVKFNPKVKIPEIDSVSVGMTEHINSRKLRLDLHGEIHA